MNAAYLAEFIGTFFLIFAGTGAIVINAHTKGAITHGGIALTFGLVVMAMVYAFGDASGAHLNPAVTLAMASLGKFSLDAVLPYIACQVAGALTASLLLRSMFPGDTTSLGATLPNGSVWRSFVMEFILTAMLMFVIFGVSSGNKIRGELAGIAVGGLIALEAMFAGPICGASMNPARSLSPAVVSGNLRHLWIYLTAPILGAIVAAALLPAVTKASPTIVPTEAAPATTAIDSQ
jgi:aquaporin Z